MENHGTPEVADALVEALRLQWAYGHPYTPKASARRFDISKIYVQSTMTDDVQCVLLPRKQSVMLLHRVDVKSSRLTRN